MNLAVFSHDRDLLASLKLNDCPLRNEQSALLRPDCRPYAPVVSRTKKVARIGKDTRDANGACSRIYFTIGKVDRAISFIDSAVGKKQLQRYAPALFLHACLSRKSTMKLGELLLTHREISLDRIYLRHRRKH